MVHARRCHAQSLHAVLSPDQLACIAPVTSLILFFSTRPIGSPPRLFERATDFGKGFLHARAWTNEIGMQTYKLSWTVQNQLSNPARTNATRAGRKLGDESSWSRSLIRHQSRQLYFIILTSLAGTVITRIDYFTFVIGRFPTLSLGNFSRMTTV